MNLKLQVFKKNRIKTYITLYTNDFHSYHFDFWFVSLLYKNIKQLTVCTIITVSKSQFNFTKTVSFKQCSECQIEQL